MPDALRRLLEGVIDYAGLFPPATLSMAEAVDLYLQYRQGPASFLVSRFICPAARLSELADALASREVRESVEVSVIGRGGADEASWRDGMAADAADMNAFSEAAADTAAICAYEVRIGAGCDIARCARDLRGFSDVEVYAELGWDDRLEDRLAGLAEAEWLGAKGRTGGTERSAFPSAEQLALFLRECSNLDLPFKLTAGLHEPLRHDDPELGPMHGFLNILMALALINAHDLTLREIALVLQEEDGGAFQVDGGRLGWRDLEAGLLDAEAARDLFVAFGSCSVDEPLAGLSRLGLLPAVGV